MVVHAPSGGSTFSRYCPCSAETLMTRSFFWFTIVPFGVVSRHPPYCSIWLFCSMVIVPAASARAGTAAMVAAVMRDRSARFTVTALAIGKGGRGKKESIKSNNCFFVNYLPRRLESFFPDGQKFLNWLREQ